MSLVDKITSIYKRLGHHACKLVLFKKKGVFYKLKRISRSFIALENIFRKTIYNLYHDHHSFKEVGVDIQPYRLDVVEYEKLRLNVILQGYGLSSVYAENIVTKYQNFTALEVLDKHTIDDHLSFSIDHMYMLKSHTSAISIPMLTEYQKGFYILSRAFRNDHGKNHLKSFYQLEIALPIKEPAMSGLIALLKDILIRFFEKPITYRIRKNFFPFTGDTSIEIDIKTNEEKFIEVMGAGCYVDKICQKVKIKGPIIACGIGVERLISIKYGKSIKELY